MASVVVLKKFVNLHYNRGVAGVCDIDRFNNSSQGRFAHRPPVLMFSVSCIHKFINLHSLRKKFDSNASDDPAVIRVS